MKSLFELVHSPFPPPPPHPPGGGRTERGPGWPLQDIRFVLGRSGPNLEPGTMRVYATNGPRNGLNIGRKVRLCPGSRGRWVFGLGCMPCLKPFMPQTHTVPGCRLGPGLPRPLYKNTIIRTLFSPPPPPLFEPPPLPYIAHYCAI